MIHFRRRREGRTSAGWRPAARFFGISSVVGVAEWFKAPGCGPGDRGFESLRPPHRFDITLLLLLVLLPLVLASCGGGPQLPEGFPSDFPLYASATITAAGRVSAAQGDIYAIGMETSDALEAVRSFYEETLNAGAWEVTNVVEIVEQGTVVIQFARREGGGLAGTVAISQEQTDGQKTIIAIQLPAAGAAGTATATASPGS